jgi:hypothetical protein
MNQDQSMSILKRGQRCVIIAGCPENIGLIVEVICRLGRCQGRDDAYQINTVSGRKFSQFRIGEALRAAWSNECVTDRHKLRPLLDPKVDLDEVDEVAPGPRVMPVQGSGRVRVAA